jgi:hypothetical protein
MLATLLQQILNLGGAALQSEAAACDALVALRFPDGITCSVCGAACDREHAHVVCRGPSSHRFTILKGTPLETKRKPRIQALLIAIRAFATSNRSISARELAAATNAPLATLWRHLLTLRAMLPPPPSPTPASTDGERFAVTRAAAIEARFDPTKHTADGARVVIQAVRTWLNGTFHGVSLGWLSLYLRELSARRICGDTLVAGALLELLVSGGARLTFRVVRATAAA